MTLSSVAISRRRPFTSVSIVYRVGGLKHAGPPTSTKGDAYERRDWSLRARRSRTGRRLEEGRRSRAPRCQEVQAALLDVRASMKGDAYERRISSRPPTGGCRVGLDEGRRSRASRWAGVSVGCRAAATWMKGDARERRDQPRAQLLVAGPVGALMKGDTYERRDFAGVRQNAAAVHRASMKGDSRASRYGRPRQERIGHRTASMKRDARERRDRYADFLHVGFIGPR